MIASYINRKNLLHDRTRIGLVLHELTSSLSSLIFIVIIISTAHHLHHIIYHYSSPRVEVIHSVCMYVAVKKVSYYEVSLVAFGLGK